MVEADKGSPVQTRDSPHRTTQRARSAALLGEPILRASTFLPNGRKRVEKLRYMHRNPVKRGLVGAPEMWSWSSFRAYAYQELGPVRVNDWDMLTLKSREVESFPS